MELSFNNKGDLLLISVAGRLDTLASQEFLSALERELKPEVRNVDVDCNGLEYISSSGLRCLMTIYKRIAPAGGTLTLNGLAAQVKEVLEITGMASLFKIC